VHITNSHSSGGKEFDTIPQNATMEKRIIGIILTLMGIGGLIYAGIEFMNGNGQGHVKRVAMYGILGAIFFFAGIGLIKNTRDKASS
jgi:hypothetical protein